MTAEPDGVLDGQVIVTRVVEPDDVIVGVETSEGLSVLEAVGMLAMAADSLLHPEVWPELEGEETP